MTTATQAADGPPKRPPRKKKGEAAVQWTPPPEPSPVVVVVAPPPEPPVLVDTQPLKDPYIPEDDPDNQMEDEPSPRRRIRPVEEPVPTAHAIPTAPVAPSRAEAREQQRHVAQTVAETVASLGVDPNDISVTLVRQRPMFDEDGEEIVGHTATYPYAPEPEEIKAQFGGGTFRAMIYVPDPVTGAKVMRKNIPVVIAGPPKNPDGKKKKDRLAERSNVDNSTEVARMVVESKEKEADRMHQALEAERKQNAMLVAAQLNAKAAPVAADGVKELAAVLIPAAMTAFTAYMEAADRRATADREAADRRATVEREAANRAHEAQMAILKSMTTKPADDATTLMARLDANAQASNNAMLKLVSDNANTVIQVINSARETERALLTKTNNAQKDDFSATMDNMLKLKQLSTLMEPKDNTPATSPLVEAVKEVMGAGPGLITAFLGGRNPSAAAKPAAPAAGVKPGSVAKVRVPVPAQPRALPPARKQPKPPAAAAAAETVTVTPPPSPVLADAATVELPAITPVVLTPPVLTVPVQEWLPDPVPDTADSAALIRHFIGSVEGALAADWSESRVYDDIVKKHPPDTLTLFKGADPEKALTTLLSIAAEDSVLATPRGKRFLGVLFDKLQLE